MPVDLVLSAPPPRPVQLELDRLVGEGLIEIVAPLRYRCVSEVRARLPRDFGFADFWAAYPRRNGRLVGKAKALERWSKFDKDTRRLALRAAKKYARACEADETIAKDPERFLLKDYWRDWLEDPT